MSDLIFRKLVFCYNVPFQDCYLRLVGGYVDDKALNGSDFPREEKKVPKGDGSNKYNSKCMF